MTTYNAYERVASAGSHDGTPNSLEFRCSPSYEPPWSLLFYTLRLTKAGRCVRKSYRVYGHNDWECIEKADKIVRSMQPSIDAAREAWRLRYSEGVR